MAKKKQNEGAVWPRGSGYHREQAGKYIRELRRQVRRVRGLGRREKSQPLGVEDLAEIEVIEELDRWIRLLRHRVATDRKKLTLAEFARFSRQLTDWVEKKVVHIRRLGLGVKASDTGGGFDDDE